MESNKSYTSPEMDIINIEIECSILSSSGSTNVGVRDWEDEIL